MYFSMNLSLLAIIILFSIPFTFVYADNIGRLALELEDSPGSGTFTEVWFEQGNQGFRWDQITVDLSSEDNTGQRQLRFVATETVAGIHSDMAVDEILIQSLVSHTVISSEDFKKGFRTWVNTGGDDNNCWRPRNSPTPTANTGPSSGADGTVRYVYYESSNGCSPGAGQQAFLAGPIIDFDEFNSVEITFSRHMWDSVHRASIPDLDFLVYKGIQYNTLGDYETAISIFKNVLKKDKNNFGALANLGDSYSLLQKYNKAILNYESALGIEPNDGTTLYRLQKALLETTAYRYGFLDGVLEIKVYDSQGGLIAYLQTSKIKALKHTMSEKLVESWPIYKTINRNNQDYFVYQKEFVEVLDKKTILGFHEIPFSDKMDLPLATTWHYQIPVEKGDTVSYVYSIFRPVS